MGWADVNKTESILLTLIGQLQFELFLDSFSRCEAKASFICVKHGPMGLVSKLLEWKVFPL